MKPEFGNAAHIELLELGAKALKVGNQHAELEILYTCDNCGFDSEDENDAYVYLPLEKNYRCKCCYFILDNI